MTPETLPYDQTIRDTNGIKLEMATAGRVGQPLVILLHGFPDLWQGWHLQIPALEVAGFRVVIPNQRGYGQSDKPRGVQHYDLDHLSSDIIKIADSENAERFYLVGHDWGGIVGWWVAANFPECISRLVVLNAPHPGVFKHYLFRHPRQLLRSWYTGFFQLPWLPEMLLAARNYELLFQSVKKTSGAGIFDESDRRYLTDGWSKPRALTSMLNYYRAFARRATDPLQKRVTVPTLIQFSKRDPTMESGLAEASLAQCDNARIAWFENAKHWLQREEAEHVTTNTVEFISNK